MHYIGSPTSEVSNHLLKSASAVSRSVEGMNGAQAAPSISTVRSQVPFGDAPEHASIATVNRWSWSELEGTQDRKRVVSKAIYALSSTDRESIRQRLGKIGRANMIRELPACVNMLLRGENKIPGILPQDSPKIVIFTKLFLCWWFCGDYIAQEPSKQHLEELADSLREGSPDPATFCDYAATVLGTTFSRTAVNNPTQPSQAEIIEISDDDEPPPRISMQRQRNIDKPGSLQKSSSTVLD
jgi:hypothetical protein